MGITLENAFGMVLKEIREEKGLSQMELVRRSNLDRTTIPRYEQGKLSPTLKNTFIIAEALEVKPAYIVEKIYGLLHPEK